jgi:hypothetical protein
MSSESADEFQEFEEVELPSPESSGDGSHPVVPLGDIFCPATPAELADTGVDRQILSDLVIRLAAQIPTFTTDWMANHTKLPIPIAEELLWALRQDQLVEVLGQVGPFNYKYTLTQRGSDYAAKVSHYSGYVGPAPVSLEAYTAFLLQQQHQRPRLTPEMIRSALSELVLPEHVMRVAGLAAASFRSLFLFGPPGNGKTSLGRMLHRAYSGGIWIPYCLSIEHHIVRIFDPQVHRILAPPTGAYDRRWIYIERPFIVVGGEMTLGDLDLSFNPTVHYYEAPAHFKANGGTFLLDDFGRQQMNPIDLLNRWIIPLEHQIDFLTLHTGQRIQVPFHLMLIVATNLALTEIVDDAFLRRMGYRLELQGPDEDVFLTILRRYGEQIGATVEAGIPQYVLERYQREGRVLRASEPRDLLDRARDYCAFQDRPLVVDREVLDVAWSGYFGTAAT